MGTGRRRVRSKDFERTQLASTDSWDTPIKLGNYFYKVTGLEGGKPFERWMGPYDGPFYTPEYRQAEIEVTVDELHGKFPYRVGGPFTNIKISNDFGSSSRVISGGEFYTFNQLERYEGGFKPPSRTAWGGGWTDLGPDQLAVGGNAYSNAYLPDLAPYFDQAFNRTKPKLQVANLLTFLAEASDIPKMLETTAKGFHEAWSALGGRPSDFMSAGHVSDQFLNHQFGWVPFLSDLRDFYHIYQQADEIIKNISDNNNRPMRRKVTVMKDAVTNEIYREEPTVNYSYGVPIFPVALRNDYMSAPPSWGVYETKTVSIVGSGKFRYYNPDFDLSMPDYSSAWKKAMRWATISGLRPTPTNIYNSIPWTWLAGWLSNLNDKLSRWSDSITDSVVAEYFYVSSHVELKRTFWCRVPFWSGGLNLSLERICRTKQRVSADNPYGFRPSSDLTGRQLAILGALGITRWKP